MKKILQQTPLFLFLVPVFFILHGYAENFGNITIGNCLLLTVTYTGAAALLYFIFLFFLKNYLKAALMAAYLFSFYCFYGAIHDFLKAHTGFLYKYSVLLSSFFIGIIALFIFLKKTKHVFFRTTLFLNILMLAYIVFDTGNVLWKSLNPGPNRLSVYSFAKDNTYGTCKECPKPDIYFLLFDEYASSLSLKQKYNYDNSGLDTFLRQSGFSIQVNSHSNYNFTPFSMSSILNMSYINGIDPEAITADDYAYCTNLIRDNEVIKFLAYQGYDIVNYSVFDLAGNPSRVDQSFLPLKTKLITDRTLFAYLRKDIGWMLYTGRFELKFLTANTLYKQVNNNNKFIDLVKKESAVKSAKPRFVYVHLYMPHAPYFFDKNNNLKDGPTVYREYKELNLQPYLDYIPYTNSRAKELISTIKQNTDGNAVIIFMGDHGFRYRTTVEHPDNYFQNQNAIYFPDKDYHLLKDSVSGVNQFRIVFNKLFNQDIPVLKDSTVFLKDKHDN
jgi:sulfatase-like protein